VVRDFFVILEGEVAIVEGYGGEDRVISVHGPRRFLGEIGLLTGQAAFLTAVARKPGEVLAVPVDRLRELVAEDSELGDLVLRAFLIRRSMLIELGTGFRIVGSRYSPDTRRLREFAARNRLPHRWIDLKQRDGHHLIRLDDGGSVAGRTVLVATGARYRKLPVPRLEEFEGVSVHYAATLVEAQLCRNDPVAVVGGGNSAGQATVFLTRHAARVRLLVREDDLGKSMSRYLADRIERSPGVEILRHTEVRELVGDQGVLRALVFEDNRTGSAARSRRARSSSSSARSPMRAGSEINSRSTAVASSSPAPMPSAPRRMARAGTPIVSRSCSRPVGPGCSPRATCGAGRSSGWPRPSARRPWPSAWCTTTSSTGRRHSSTGRRFRRGPWPEAAGAVPGLQPGQADRRSRSGSPYGDGGSVPSSRAASSATSSSTRTS